MKDKYFTYIIEDLFKQTKIHTAGTLTPIIVFPFHNSVPLQGYPIDVIVNCRLNCANDFIVYSGFIRETISTYGVNLKDTEELFINYLKYVRENIDRLTTKIIF